MTPLLPVSAAATAPSAVAPAPQAPRSPAPPAATAAGQHDAAADIAAVVGRANEAMMAARNGIEFTYDRAAGKSIVRVIDRESGQLIRQIPSEDMLELARALDRMQGVLVDGRA